MAYWATLWYAGVVVISMGGSELSYDECKTLTNSMITEITTSYQDEEKVTELKGTMFETNEFSVSCETKYLESDPKYKE
jgi:hypothetical protein